MESPLTSPELVADAMAPLGEAPLDVQVGASDAAGAALQAPLIGHADAIFLKPIHIGGAEVEAGLLLAPLHAHGPVSDPQMGLLIHQ